MVMSLGETGRQISCDGEDCETVAALPIALRAQLLAPEPELPAPEGWLFITGNGPNRHYCPRCAPKLLDDINGENKRPFERKSDEVVLFSAGWK